MPRKGPAVVKQPQAVIDVYRHAAYLADHGGLAVAKRFVKAVEQTIARLAESPGIGHLWESDHPRLADLRCSSVGRFRNHLVFYRPLPEGGILVVRVLHGAQDVNALFESQD